ncbi:MAG: pilin [Patescibacteria group bacterium]
MKCIKTFLISIWLLALPTIVHAQVALTNPLGETDVRVIIGRIIKGALGVSGTLAFLMIIYGGFLWMTAMGKPEQVDKGKKVLTWTILGLVLVAAAYVLTTAVFNALLTGSISGTPTP